MSEPGRLQTDGPSTANLVQTTNPAARVEGSPVCSRTRALRLGRVAQNSGPAPRPVRRVRRARQTTRSRREVAGNQERSATVGCGQRRLAQGVAVQIEPDRGRPRVLIDR